MKTYPFRQTLEGLLDKPATKEEAKFLKKEFGVVRKDASKGVLLMAALLDMAVKKASVPAAKEILAVMSGSAKADSDSGVLEALIDDLKNPED